MNSKCEFNQPRNAQKTHTRTHTLTGEHTHTHMLIRLGPGIVSSANTQMGKQKVAEKGVKVVREIENR